MEEEIRSREPPNSIQPFVFLEETRVPPSAGGAASNDVQLSPDKGPLPG